MNLTKTSLSLQLSELPSHYSIIKRLLNLILVVLVACVGLNLWLSNQQFTRNWYQQQANQLGRSLAVQAARLMASPLISADNAAIIQHLQILADDPYVSAVAVYNQKGQLIDEQDDNITIVARYQIAPDVPLVFIQDIMSDTGEIVGYLRVVLDEKKVMQFHFDYQHNLFKQLEVLLVLAVLAGVMVTRFFYTLRYRKFRKASAAIQTPPV